MDHLNAILISAINESKQVEIGMKCCTISLADFWEPGAQFQENAQIFLSYASVAIRINLQAPAQAVDVKRRGINCVAFLLKFREVFHEKDARVVGRHNFADKIGRNWSTRVAGHRL